MAREVRPQAASTLLLLRTLLGLRPDTSGEIAVRPILAPDALPLRLDGIADGGGRLTLTVAADGTVRRTRDPSD